MEELKGEKLVLSVKDCMALLGLSKNAIYSACHRGDLPTLKCGRRVLIPKPALLKLLEQGSLNLTPTGK